MRMCVEFRDKILSGGGGGGDSVKPQKIRIFEKGSNGNFDRKIETFLDLEWRNGFHR